MGKQLLGRNFNIKATLSCINTQLLNKVKFIISKKYYEGFTISHNNMFEVCEAFLLQKDVDFKCRQRIQ